MGRTRLSGEVLVEEIEGPHTRRQLWTTLDRMSGLFGLDATMTFVWQRIGAELIAIRWGDENDRATYEQRVEWLREWSDSHTDEHIQGLQDDAELLSV